MSKLQSRLVIYPSKADWVPASLPSISDVLQEIGFIEPENNSAGAKFMQLITFLGCSPNVDLDAPHRISLDKLSERVSIVVDENTTDPRCPKCRWPQQDWRDHIRNWQAQSGNTPWQCPRCGYTATVRRLDWRHSAACCRFAITISDIFPSEAIPSEQLLGVLATVSKCPWRYAYLQSRT